MRRTVGFLTALPAALVLACAEGSGPREATAVPEGVLLAQEVMERGLETASGHNGAFVGFYRPDPRTPRGERIIRDLARDEFGLSEADTELLVRRMKEDRTGPLGSGEFVPVAIPHGEPVFEGRHMGLSAAEAERLSKMEIRVPGEAGEKTGN